MDVPRVEDTRALITVTRDEVDTLVAVIKADGGTRHPHFVSAVILSMQVAQTDPVTAEHDAAFVEFATLTLKELRGAKL